MGFAAGPGAPQDEDMCAVGEAAREVHHPDADAGRGDCPGPDRHPVEFDGRRVAGSKPGPLTVAVEPTGTGAASASAASGVASTGKLVVTVRSALSVAPQDTGVVPVGKGSPESGAHPSATRPAPPPASTGRT